MPLLNGLLYYQSGTRVGSIALEGQLVTMGFFGEVDEMIATALKTFAKTIRGKSTVSVVPGFLRPIDTDKIAQSERLEARGEENGRSEIPATTASSFDSVEQAIRQKIVAEWTWQGEEFLNQLAAYSNRLAQYSIHSEHQRLQLQGADAIAELRAASVRAPAELGPLKEGYRDARKEYETFRARHQLERPAREKTRRWTTIGLLFVLVAIESVLNGVFFAEGDEFGLVGGVGTAIGISITNIVFAFLLGLGARWINYRVMVTRFLALVITAAGIALLLGLHTFAAHFRDATIVLAQTSNFAGEERAFALAIDNLLRAPWQLTELYSYYLFGLGTLFGLGAFWKGCTFDDPYPGYGPAHRRMETASNLYSDQHADFFDELKSIKDTVVEELERGIQRIPIFPQEAERIRTERAALLEAFRAYETSVQESANDLLTRYRDANRRSRNTQPPSYFDEHWKLPNSFSNNQNVSQSDVAPEQTPPMNIILSEFGQLTEEILSAYSTLNEKFPHPRDM